MEAKTINDIENNCVFLDRVADFDLGVKKALGEANFEIEFPAGFTPSDGMTVQKIKILDGVIENSENLLFLNIYPNRSSLYHSAPPHRINLTRLFKVSPGEPGQVELLFFAGTNNGIDVLMVRDDIDHAIPAAVEYSREQNKWYEQLLLVQNKIPQARKELKNLYAARGSALRQLAARLNNQTSAQRGR